jgi:hypothetical protein
VKIQPEERLAAASELNLASSPVTGCGEARGKGYWAATQVKGLCHKIFIVSEADVVPMTEGSTLIADSPTWTWQGDESPAGSETVTRYQMDRMGKYCRYTAKVEGHTKFAYISKLVGYTN